MPYPYFVPGLVRVLVSVEAFADGRHYYILTLQVIRHSLELLAWPLPRLLHS